MAGLNAVPSSTLLLDFDQFAAARHGPLKRLAAKRPRSDDVGHRCIHDGFPRLFSRRLMAGVCDTALCVRQEQNAPGRLLYPLARRLETQ